MVVDPSEFIPFSEWLSNAAGGFIVLALVIFIAWTVIAFAFTALRNTPKQAVSIVGGGLKRAILEDFPRSSLRRTIGMTRLAIQEAIRNKVLIIFALFVVLLLFAGWFLDVQNDHPARLYLGFVISTSTYLLLALAMFVSAFSLPNDIKNKTIYTITTKPVRAHEIFLGRVLGFGLVVLVEDDVEGGQALGHGDGVAAVGVEVEALREGLGQRGGHRAHCRRCGAIAPSPSGGEPPS